MKTVKRLASGKSLPTFRTMRPLETLCVPTTGPVTVRVSPACLAAWSQVIVEVLVAGPVVGCVAGGAAWTMTANENKNNPNAMRRRMEAPSLDGDSGLLSLMFHF